MTRNVLSLQSQWPEATPGLAWYQLSFDISVIMSWHAHDAQQPLQQLDCVQVSWMGHRQFACSMLMQCCRNNCSDQSGQLLRRAQLSKFRPLVTFTGFRFRAVSPSVDQSAAAASC